MTLKHPIVAPGAPTNEHETVVQRRIVDTLRSSGPLKPSTLAMACRVSRATLYRHLAELSAQCVVYKPSASPVYALCGGLKDAETVWLFEFIRANPGRTFTATAIAREFKIARHYPWPAELIEYFLEDAVKASMVHVLRLRGRAPAFTVEPRINSMTPKVLADLLS